MLECVEPGAAGRNKLNLSPVPRPHQPIPNSYVNTLRPGQAQGEARYFNPCFLAQQAQQEGLEMVSFARLPPPQRSTPPCGWPRQPQSRVRYNGAGSGGGPRRGRRRRPPEIDCKGSLRPYESKHIKDERYMNANGEVGSFQNRGAAGGGPGQAGRLQARCPGFSPVGTAPEAAQKNILLQYSRVKCRECGPHRRP